MPFELLYTSAASWPMSEVELDQLLEVARTRNAEHGLTGLLIYHDREFMQLLEGEEPAVRSIFDLIKRDQRHTSVRVFYEGTSSVRSFTGWSMGFYRFDPAHAPPGWHDVQERGMTAPSISGSRSTAFELLTTLRDLIDAPWDDHASASLPAGAGDFSVRPRHARRS